MRFRFRLGGFWVAMWLLLGANASARPPFPFHFSFRAGDSFAFIGDEITYDGRYCQYVENYFITRYPDRPVVFYNAGCRNDTVADVLERLDADIVERRINYAFVMLGTFDGAFAEYSEPRFRAFQINYGELLDRMKRARVYPFLISPPMFDQVVREQRQDDESYRFRHKTMASSYNGVMAHYSAWLREESVRRGRRFIDAWGPLNAHTSEERKINPSFSLVPDSVQPDDGGHAIIAAAILSSLALERDSLGEITLEYTGKSPAWLLKSRTGGTLSQLEGSQERVSFLWKPKSLPWAFPDAAMIGVEIAELNDRFNREVFHIVGLKPGDYRLTIAGQPISNTFSHLSLAKGLQLHRLEERPQVQRALRVARANASRYEDSVRPMRDHWETIKRTRRNHPGDDARNVEIMTELSPKMAALRLQSREALTALYESAKPLSRQFEFRRIPTASEQKAAEEAARKAKEEAAKAQKEAASP